MSLFEFSRLPAYRRKGSQERLLRAAVYAFCSLPRPSRREIAQLDDLALPLVERSSSETRRYIAAALSECAEPPPRLVRRLCAEPVELCAPLLIRSRALCDIDLIALIGRHGMGHARAIARRRDLNPRIAELIAALERLDAAAQEANETGRGTVEEARAKLRAMMLPNQAEISADEAKQPAAPAPRWQAPPDAFDTLRAAALSGPPEPFCQTLARMLCLAPDQARALTRAHGWNEFPIAMRALGFSAEQGFLLAACVFGRQFGDLEAIRLFLDRFAAISPEAARATLRDWRMSATGAMPSLDAEAPEETEIPAPANEAGAAALGLFRAS